MSLDRPLFVIGSGRCGTTMLFNLLAKHPACAWPCLWLDSGHGPRGDYPQPEPYRMWDRLYRGFRQPCRDLKAADAPEDLPERVQALWTEQTEYTQRARFITKWTGWGRIPFMERVCPGGLYLNVLRDGRAVAWSLMQQEWWRGWTGPHNWRFGMLSIRHQAAWDKSGQSFYVLAGIEWEILCNSIMEHGAALGDRFMTVRYEDLMRDFRGTMAGILLWADLPETAAYNRFLEEFAPRNANDKWRRECPPSEQGWFAEILGSALIRHGYT